MANNREVSSPAITFPVAAQLMLTSLANWKRTHVRVVELEGQPKMSHNSSDQLIGSEDNLERIRRAFPPDSVPQPPASRIGSLIDGRSMYAFLGPQFCIQRHLPSGQVHQVPEPIYEAPGPPVPKQRTKFSDPPSRIPSSANDRQSPSTEVPNPITATDPETNGTPPMRPLRRSEFPGTSSQEIADSCESSAQDSKRPTVQELLAMGVTMNEVIASGMSLEEVEFQDIIEHYSTKSPTLDAAGTVAPAGRSVNKIYPELPVAEDHTFEVGSDLDKTTRNETFETADPEPAGCQGLILWQIDSKTPPEICWVTIEHSKLIVCRNSDRRQILCLDGLKGLVSVGDPLEEAAEESSKFRFEMVAAGWQASGKTLITASRVEKSIWLQWILRASTCPLDSALTNSFTRAGSVYIKENVSGEWRQAWILLCMEQKLLHRQYLDYDGPMHTQVFEADLRKIRSINLIHNSGLNHQFNQKAAGTCVVLTWTGFALYIESIMKSETEKWLQFFQKTVDQVGRSLEDKQLTHENIPVLMDKCIQFIELHGLRSLGIYRRSGVQSHVNALMANLESNPSFHILPEEYDEHDCATVLKRFFRDLPHPLLSDAKEWIEACDLEPSVQIDKFKSLIASLPDPAEQVLKRLLHHLCLLQEFQDENGASVANLASVWGPTLLLSVGDSDYQLLNAVIAVVNALITNFKEIFDIDWNAEKEKTSIQNALRKSKGQLHRSQSSNFIMWIKNQVTDKDLHFVIAPQMKAIEMAKKMVLEVTRFEEINFLLLEVVHGGYLYRPIHKDELLIDILLKWSTWKSNECRDNHLCFKMDDFLSNGLNQVRKFGMRRCYIVHFSTPSKKKFKSGTVEFVDNHMVFKNGKGLVPLGQKPPIKLEISKQKCFFGYDPIRTPPTSWNLTFIPKFEDLPE